MSTFAERLELARKEKGITQKWLSEQIRITDAYMSQMSTGKRIPAERTMQDLADALGVNYEWLANGNGPKKPDLSREEEIAEVVATILKEEPGSTKERIIKIIASLTYEEMQVIEKIIDQLTNK